MRRKTIKADTSGFIVQFDEDDIYYVAGYNPRSFLYMYKDQRSFDDQVGICYIAQDDMFDNGDEYLVSDRMYAFAERHQYVFFCKDRGYTHNDLWCEVRDTLDCKLSEDPDYPNWLECIDEEYGHAFGIDFVDSIMDEIFSKLQGQPVSKVLDEFDYLAHWKQFVNNKKQSL